MKTAAAWPGIGRDHAVPGFPIPTLDSGLWTLDFTNHPGKFVAEDGGGHDHFGVITAFEDLQIRAAGERGFDADADFARFERGRRDVLNLDIFPAVQDGGFHAHSLCA